MARIRKSFILVFIIIFLGVSCNMKQLYNDPALSKEQMLHLVKQGAYLYRYLCTGGEDAKPYENDFSTIIITDEKINSKEKIVNLLTEIYTEKAAKDIYNSLMFKEENGQLLKPNAEYVFTEIWDKITIKKFFYKDNKIIAVFEVPQEVGAEIYEPRLIEVEYMLNDNKEWKLNTIVT